jgi:hypothetical protein
VLAINFSASWDVDGKQGRYDTKLDVPWLGAAQEHAKDGSWIRASFEKPQRRY